LAKRSSRTRAEAVFKILRARTQPRFRVKAEDRKAFEDWFRHNIPAKNVRISSSSITKFSSQNVLENKRTELKKFLRARGYDVDTKKQLSESIKQEMRIQENLLANRKITVLLAKTKNNVFTVQRQMPSTEALIRNKKLWLERCKTVRF